MQIDRRQDPAAVGRILRALPEWFGVESAIDHYVESAATRGFYLAQGFLPLHEFEGIDWDGPTLVLVKPL